MRASAWGDKRPGTGSSPAAFPGALAGSGTGSPAVRTAAVSLWDASLSGHHLTSCTTMLAPVLFVRENSPSPQDHRH